MTKEDNKAANVAKATNVKGFTVGEEKQKRHPAPSAEAKATEITPVQPVPTLTKRKRLQPPWAPGPGAGAGNRLGVWESVLSKERLSRDSRPGPSCDPSLSLERGQTSLRFPFKRKE
ncbi:hypothetical protein SARC_00721 [Sphaeroforma arctica JP610]|uniref:Uncharacterized protein n=1 Tax=Sphaeroforma arctica JP610 TaxID=667725 RepID=A0A0L0GFT3_9EUKA|nr:hypothetical protein SARC_00721 [Sphaeroforma arctica JP610]KNC87138.1 hypothetical protein SARC_00721 [Sphaeroforma arctica JP610]|eukprot:XP_014161040.1 hypothetical protein SARC_00721 [Sphaeroforma arctica JP610]